MTSIKTFTLFILSLSLFALIGLSDIFIDNSQSGTSYTGTWPDSGGTTP